jgi:hypothetical protein
MISSVDLRRGSYGRPTVSITNGAPSVDMICVCAIDELFIVVFRLEASLFDEHQLNLGLQRPGWASAWAQNFIKGCGSHAGHFATNMLKQTARL